MTIEELQQKIQSGQALSETDQKEFLALFDAQLAKIKQEQPDHYIGLLKELTSIVQGLNKAVKEAQA